LRQSCEQLAPDVLLAPGLADEQALPGAVGGERGAAQARQGGENQPALRRAEAGTPGENPASAEPAASRETRTAHAAGQDSEDLPGINPGAEQSSVLLRSRVGTRSRRAVMPPACRPPRRPRLQAARL